MLDKLARLFGHRPSNSLLLYVLFFPSLLIIPFFSPIKPAHALDDNLLKARSELASSRKQFYDAYDKLPPKQRTPENVEKLKKQFLAPAQNMITNIINEKHKEEQKKAGIKDVKDLKKSDRKLKQSETDLKAKKYDKNTLKKISASFSNIESATQTIKKDIDKEPPKKEEKPSKKKTTNTYPKTKGLTLDGKDIERVIEYGTTPGQKTAVPKTEPAQKALDGSDIPNTIEY